MIRLFRWLADFWICSFRFLFKNTSDLFRVFTVLGGLFELTKFLLLEYVFFFKFFIFLKSKPKEEYVNPTKNYIDVLKDKDKEIDKLKKELFALKSIINIKPTLSNDMKLNENYSNNHKSLSTSNRNNSNSVFKFDMKNNLNERVEVFSERSPTIKQMNNYNNFNNINLTNRNSYTSKNFMEIFNNYNTNQTNVNNSQNLNSNKNQNKPNSKNFSSTFSNFFRKSNKKTNDNSTNNILRDGFKSKFF